MRVCPPKLYTPLNTILPNAEDTNSSLEQKDHIKSIGVMIDDKISEKHINIMPIKKTKEAKMHYCR